MENLQVNNNLALPVLKPILLSPKFVQRVKGERLKSDVMLLITEDDDYVFFISGLRDWKEEYKDNPYIVKLHCEEGLDEQGSPKMIEIAKAVDLSAIFKMNYFDLRNKIINKNNEVDSLAYLGIKDQIAIVNKVMELLNDNKMRPTLVLIQRRKKCLDDESDIKAEVIEEKEKQSTSEVK